MQDTFARATHSAGRPSAARDDRVSCIQLIITNDIVHSSPQGELVIFADDTNIFIAAKTKKEAYNNVSNHVHRSIDAYMHANQLHINFSKCARMYFRPNHNYRERMKCARSECYKYNPTLTL